jgi:hypothetical protein
MGDFKVNIDISALSQYLENFAKEVTKDIQKGIKGLAMEAHVHILEEAKKKLHKHELPIYEQDLSQATQIDDFLWEISLIDEGAKIENGREAWDMKPGLLKNGKTTVDGKNKYRVIPMMHGKESNSTNTKILDKNEETINNIKSFLKTQKSKQNPRGLPYGLETHKIIDPITGSPRRVPRLSEMGEDGKPRPLHVFDIPSKIPGKGNTALLTRLHIYQVETGKGGVKKVMTTFRTVTDKDNQKDKWIYPAQGAKNIFSETEDWAKNQWDTIWLPQILAKYK